MMLLATVTFAIQMAGDPQQQYLNGLILDHVSFLALFGHMWLHMSAAHIVGNLLTLWIFGRHVALKVGNANFLLIYVLLGLAAATVHVLYDGRPTIGASGAIMGVLGMHVVLCFRRFSAVGPWLVLTWFFLNLTAALIGGYPTTYAAHLGGFVAGILMASVLIVLKVAECDETDRTLVELLSPSLLRNRPSGHSRVIGEPEP
ncbi:MAG: rhomboid family intramembrane serine protease [Phycisphaerales bacterium]|nr:MAG: rhomboid family intramembrane serine protease [Phycisphaerales bacterium]